VLEVEVTGADVPVDVALWVWVEVVAEAPMVAAIDTPSLLSQHVLFPPQQNVPSLHSITATFLSDLSPFCTHQLLIKKYKIRDGWLTAFFAHSDRQNGLSQVGSVHPSRQSSLSPVFWHNPFGRHTSGSMAPVWFVPQHMDTLPATWLHG
jgi:hypothetical protein